MRLQPRFPSLVVELPEEPHAFMVAGRAAQAMRDYGCEAADIEEFYEAICRTTTTEELIAAVKRWVIVE